jgi:hypothetical protein
MRRMNLTRSSRLALWLGVAFVLVLVVGALGAAAVPFEGDVPESAEVGDEVTVEELTMTDPFEVSGGDAWTMQVSTGLDSPRLQVTAEDSAGNTILERDVTENRVLLEINDTSISEIQFQVRGDVPEIGGTGPGEYSYENRAQENVTVLEVKDVFDGQTRTVENGEYELHRFTPGSQEARQAIDSASEAVESADSGSARERLDEAVTFYNSEQFDSAIEAANDAESTANSEGETRELLLLVGGVLAVLVAVGGLAYYLRSRQETENTLR